jgi:uncharacterized OsmC-like protein
MPKMTFSATTKKLGAGLTAESESRGFRVTLDEPAELGGTNKGMNPMEMVLCALGGCQVIAASAFAAQKGVDIQDMWVEVEGDFDPAGFMGDFSVRPGYSQIRFKLHIRSSSPADKVEEYVEYVEKICPVGDSLMNPVDVVKTDVVIEPAEKVCCSSCCACGE